ncbi:MAG: DsbA family protein [Acidobacteria bacterium]|nr:DsbA family protein [Acidobacteriota bacterium]
MRKYLSILAGILLMVPVGRTQAPAKQPAKAPAAAAPAPAPAPSEPQSPLQKSVESYLRNLYAWGPEFTVAVASPKPSNIPGFNSVAVQITLNGQSDAGEFFVSNDGHYLLRGEMHDLTVNPFALIKSQINVDGIPSKGPPNAPVTIVEYSDLQCPACREMSKAIRAVLPSYPNVRFVFKHFPLKQIHPWASNAANAAYCSYQQSPETFWKFHDLVFDNQDAIKTDTAWQMILDYANQAGADTDRLKVCMTNPATAQAIEASIAEGTQLKIRQTPTSFINGRRLEGGDRGALEQLLKFEIAAATKGAKKP